MAYAVSSYPLKPFFSLPETFDFRQLIYNELHFAKHFHYRGASADGTALSVIILFITKLKLLIFHYE